MSASNGIVSGVRVSHDHATFDAIETAGRDDERTIVERLLTDESVSEAFALRTCNRVEAYVVTGTGAEGRRALSSFAPGVPDGAVLEMSHEESLRHLMRVAASLESLVLGEDQIIGQVRDAFETAREAGGIGPVLEGAVVKAIRVGERARTETRINEGSVSVGSAAATLAARDRDLAGATALVVGAGEMGRLAAHALADTGVATIYVANRSPSGAERIAEVVGHGDVRPVGLDALPTALAGADLAISATGSPDYVLDAGLLADAGDLLVIDIAQPRDVAPDAADVPGVDVRDLEALRTVTDATMERRREAAREIEAMIDDEFERLQDQYKRRRADEVIGRMYESAEELKRREVDVALSKLEARGDLSEEGREIVESMADSLVSHLLAPPTKSLRQAAADDDWTTINTALQLFNPEFKGRMPPFATGDSDDAPASDVGRRSSAERTESDDAPADSPAEMPADVAAEPADDD